MSEINDTEETPAGNFPTDLKLTAQYQRTEPILMAKYKEGTYQKNSFCGRSNIELNLITCEDNIFILSILQSYILHWYHTYLLHLVMDRTEAIIFQHFYWPGIRYAVRKEVTNCDTCQREKSSNIKYGKLTAKEAEEIPRNKLCVDLIGPYVIQIKGRKKTYN